MTKKTISWIEDDAPTIHPVVFPLERRGFRIEIYPGLVPALAKIEEISRSDLILLDMLVPSPDRGYSGLEFLRALKKRNIRTPVIVFTVVTNEGALADAKSFDVVKKVLRKPILPSVLESAVDEILG